MVREKQVKSILSKSGIPGVDYCLNPYVGCAHGCKYCYAAFMKRFTGHTEPWGAFVDVKVNAPEVLDRQIKRTARGYVMLSSVTDPYQPLEKEYGLTRRCLEILLRHEFPVGILTKSPLILRDLDLIEQFDEMEVGITITTDDDEIKKIFEPATPPLDARIQALKEIHDRGISTYAFIGPLLPQNPEKLAGRISPYVDSVLVDRMNYLNKTIGLYRRHRLADWLESDFVDEIIKRLKAALSGKKVNIG
ncbi:MAG: radical SAM protein [Syntrophaceae bacterium]|nr:radical SAM protein [Syntrophaceae bacterium]